LERLLNEAATRTLTLRYDYRQTALTNLLIPDLVSPEDQHVRLSTLSGTYVRDTRDHPLDAHKGIVPDAGTWHQSDRAWVKCELCQTARAAGLLQGDRKGDCLGEQPADWS